MQGPQISRQGKINIDLGSELPTPTNVIKVHLPLPDITRLELEVFAFRMKHFIVSFIILSFSLI